jgi:hypothetical protein
VHALISDAIDGNCVKHIFVGKGFSREVRAALAHMLGGQTNKQANKTITRSAYTILSTTHRSDEGNQCASEVIALIDDDFISSRGLTREALVTSGLECLHEHSIRLMLFIGGRSLDGTERHVDLMEASIGYLSHRRMPINDMAAMATHISEFLFSGQSTLAQW